MKELRRKPKTSDEPPRVKPNAAPFLAGLVGLLPSGKVDPTSTPVQIPSRLLFAGVAGIIGAALFDTMSSAPAKPTLKSEKPPSCPFIRAWIGHCNKPIAAGSSYCAEHARLTCVSCDAQATGECSAALGLVCGSPLCNDCQHDSNGANLYNSHKKREKCGSCRATPGTNGLCGECRVTSGIDPRPVEETIR